MLRKLIIAAAAMLLTIGAFAADEPEKPWKYVNAKELRIINKGFNDTERDFSRLPAYLKDSVRTSLWDRQQCSSGIGVRFATNSSRIGVRYKLHLNTHMIHMADTGLKGTDLYIFEGDSVWRHVNTNRPYISDKYPKEEKIVESLYVSNLDTAHMTEYMVYFPLYDGIEWLEIKVDENADINAGATSLIDPDRKIIAYGTSILQGGCASRTGMAATNILSRMLNAEVVNLGFSGDGKMDSEVARALASIPDVDMYILDPVPNCTEMMCDTLTYGFVKILRDAKPDVPIVMVEGPLYPYYRYDSFFNKYLPAKNEKYRKNYDKLKAENPANLYYVDSVNLDGVENDGTVDGIHLTDLGFKYYAEKLYPEIRPLLDASVEAKHQRIAAEKAKAQTKDGKKKNKKAAKGRKNK